MEQRMETILFASLRSAIRGDKLTDAECACFLEEQLPSLFAIAKKHDVLHLLFVALKQNGLLREEYPEAEKALFSAMFRYEQLDYEYRELCEAFEAAEIPFVPLKGSILRAYYPEAWMRTSCDVDVLVRRDDLERAIAYLVQKLKYKETERGTHDVSLFSTTGGHVELHFDLVEEEYAQNAIDVLRAVWEDVTPCENRRYQCKMSDAFFYFYHIAHMAKHFENGGSGIRSFIDLWILEGLEGADAQKRDALLEKGGLLTFASHARRLCRMWFEGEEHDALLLQMQRFLLHGGVYGTSDSRVALRQKKRGGKFGYLISRIFIPFAKLKRYYPILEKHPWLMPAMQVRRWFMLFKPDVAKMARAELAANRTMSQKTADKMATFLDDVGLGQRQ
ncbi:MAG: hypothetical protein E7606_05770 [Ruminococcaceae bacterium]|nr:hypothetical protein [Oscillospiraceae bacterium]